MTSMLFGHTSMVLSALLAAQTTYLCVASTRKKLLAPSGEGAGIR